MENIRYFIIMILGCFASCKQNNSDFPNRVDHPKYTLTAEQTSFSETLKNGEYLTEFGIRLELRPKFDSLPPIYYWTCAWQQYGFLDYGFQDYKHYYGGRGGCDTNFEIFTYLNYNDALEIQTTIRRNGQFRDFKNPKLQFGYHILDTTEIHWSKKLIHDSVTSIKEDSLLQLDDHIVWSNIISLKNLSNPVSDGFDEAYPVTNIENFAFQIDSLKFTEVWYDQIETRHSLYLKFDRLSPHFNGYKPNQQLLHEFKKAQIAEYVTSTKTHCIIVGTWDKNDDGPISEFYLITFGNRGVFDYQLIGTMRDSISISSTITNDLVIVNKTYRGQIEKNKYVVDKTGKISLTDAKNP